ncbi:hypothetical protein LOTGIDRAFT_116123, partial [Lottia gigantea]
NMELCCVIYFNLFVCLYFQVNTCRRWNCVVLFILICLFMELCCVIYFNLFVCLYFQVNTCRRWNCVVLFILICLFVYIFR